MLLPCPVVASQKNGSGFKRRIYFSRAEDRKKFALLKTILNARKQRQLMQQVMNSVRHG